MTVLIMDPRINTHAFDLKLLCSHFCQMIDYKFDIPYFLIWFPWKLFFFVFGNPKVIVHKVKSHSYINVRKLFKGGNYSGAGTIWGNTIYEKLIIRLKVLPNTYQKSSPCRILQKFRPEKPESWTAEKVLYLPSILLYGRNFVSGTDGSRIL